VQNLFHFPSPSKDGISPENWWFTKSVTFPFVVVFVAAGCIVFVLAVVVSYTVVFLYCVCALNVCNVCYLSVVSYCCTNVTGLKPNLFVCLFY
jgi:hypothetical protein